MNRRLYGLLTLPAIFNGPYQAQELKLSGKKKSAVRGKVVGCSKCGATQVTLRKAKEGMFRDKKEFLLCPKCYAKGGYR